MAILSPGSRCAPLLLAFARHPEITCYSMSDERSAGFVALGMARTTGLPVVLVCTSGGAAYNYAPAVAEAFFQQLPLIILTADRPPEWIGQQDGQTIFQPDLYGSHVKKSYAIQPDLTHSDAQWHLHRIGYDAVDLAMAPPYGPVHINFPFREPFYPEEDDDYFTDVPAGRYPARVLQFPEANEELLDEELRNQWMELPRKLILPGQYPRKNEVLQPLERLTKARNIPVSGDIIANVHSLETAFGHADIFIAPGSTENYEYLSPDLLITYGLSVISKNVKTLLRTHPPNEHWHIQPAGEVADTFRSITRVIRMEPELFFRIINELPLDSDFVAQKQANYFHLWQHEESRTSRYLGEFFGGKDYFGEFEMVRETLELLPDGSVLHLANSMAVRYANYLGLTSSQASTEVFSNRGTSGIDGCTSTAVGAAIARPDRLHVLITGDVGFFYDRNAFWHNYNLSNLRILLLNNHGGGIFRLINGPARQPEYKEYFETHQPLTGKHLATEFGIEYMLCDRKSKVKNFLKDFFEKGNVPKLLEFESDPESNQEILAACKNGFKEFK